MQTLSRFLKLIGTLFILTLFTLIALANHEPVSITVFWNLRYELPLFVALLLSGTIGFMGGCLLVIMDRIRHYRQMVHLQHKITALEQALSAKKLSHTLADTTLKESTPLLSFRAD